MKAWCLSDFTHAEATFSACAGPCSPKSEQIPVGSLGRPYEAHGRVALAERRGVLQHMPQVGVAASRTGRGQGLLTMPTSIRASEDWNNVNLLWFWSEGWN